MCFPLYSTKQNPSANKKHFSFVLLVYFTAVSWTWLSWWGGKKLVSCFFVCPPLAKELFLAYIFIACCWLFPPSCKRLHVSLWENCFPGLMVEGVLSEIKVSETIWKMINFSKIKFWCNWKPSCKIIMNLICLHDFWNIYFHSLCNVNFV